MMPVRYDPWVVGLSFLIATLAAYVALDLARRVRSADQGVALAWWAGGSIAMGTGVWAMHFVGMLAYQLPIEVGYDYLFTGLSWLAGVGASSIALWEASRPAMNAKRLGAAAVFMGAGICAMHYIGMAAVHMAPGPIWSPSLVAASVGIAVAASAAAMLIFCHLRQLASQRARWWHMSAALAMATAITGMHFTGMAAVDFADGAVCLSVNQLRGDSLGMLVAAAAVVLMTLTLLASALMDVRSHAGTAALAQSLQVANGKLQRVVFRDALTNLPNRLAFEDCVAQSIQRCDSQGGTLAVLYIDLDGFKPINDAFGHPVGDKVLCAMAERLSAITPPGDVAARVGGDEFVVLLNQSAFAAAPAGSSDITSAASAEAMAQELMAAICQPVALGVTEARLGCSIGIALYPQDGHSGELVGLADSAMYAAKRAGGSSVVFYAPHMSVDVREQIELRRDLRYALDQGGELALHYQPKLRCSDQQACGAEALARWHHPRRGMVPPGVFIPLAERFGMIGDLGDWVINEACHQLRDWRDQGHVIQLSINLSTAQLHQDDLAQRVARALHCHGINAGQLTFEITESMAIHDTTASLRSLRALLELGAGLSIDDFGVGHSSLIGLRQIPAREIKIDRSFVSSLDDDAAARVIVQAVIGMAHGLHMRVVAEGIETPQQRDTLRAMGCDEMQGYLFAKPMPGRALLAWLAAARAAVPAEPAPAAPGAGKGAAAGAASSAAAAGATVRVADHHESAVLT